MSSVRDDDRWRDPSRDAFQPRTEFERFIAADRYGIHSSGLPIEEVYEPPRYSQEESATRYQFFSGNLWRFLMFARHPDTKDWWVVNKEGPRLYLVMSRDQLTDDTQSKDLRLREDTQRYIEYDVGSNQWVFRDSPDNGGGR